MRKLLRFVSKLFLGLTSFVVGYFLFAYILSWSTTSPAPTFGEKNQEIFITSNGVHVDIVVPKYLLDGHNLSGLARVQESEFIAFGWGDKGFYLDTPTWAELKASTALEALFWKSETAMHVTYYNTKRANWIPIKVNTEQINSLLQNIIYSFDLSKRSFHRIPNASYGDNDEFYEALGSYTALKTCNSWANQTLKAGHIETARWAPFDWCILRNFE